jgi:hypothetical protein
MAAPAIAMTREMNGTCSGEAPLAPPVLEDVPVDVVVLVDLEVELLVLLESVLLPVEVELVEVPGSCQWVSWTSSAKGVGEKMFTSPAGKVDYRPVAGLTVLHASAQGRWNFVAAEARGVGAVKQTESVSETIAQANQN